MSALTCDSLGVGMLSLLTVTIVTYSVTIVTFLAMIEKRKNSSELTLRLLLKRADLKQIELAEITGLSTDAIRAYVAGRRMPSFDSAVLLARGLGVSLKTLAEAFGIDVEDIPNDEPPSE